MSLTGKEVAQMHKDYVMQSWARSGADTLPVERAEGIYFTIMNGKKYSRYGFTSGVFQPRT